MTAALLRSWRRTWAISTASTISSSFSLPRVQREMLDAFAGAGSVGGTPSRLYSRAGARLRAELEELDRTAQEKLRHGRSVGFQRKEIEAVAPQPGEDAQLENERRVLRNVVRLEEIAGAAYAALYEDPEARRAAARGREAPGRTGAHRRSIARTSLAALQPAPHRGRGSRARAAPLSGQAGGRSRRGSKKWKRGWPRSKS